MVDETAPDDGDRLEAAVRVCGESGHRGAVVHVPARRVAEVLAERAVGDVDGGSEIRGPLRVVVDVVHGEQERVQRGPRGAETKDLCRAGGGAHGASRRKIVESFTSHDLNVRAAGRHSPSVRDGLRLGLQRGLVARERDRGRQHHADRRRDDGQTDPETRRRSSSTVMPRKIATTGSPIVMAGSDADSGPTWNARCWRYTPTTPAASRA